MSEVTLKKLADMLNLSISTVSRALKDHPDISGDTRIKVKELAGVLDYEPNTYAINLRTNHSKEFGIIVPGIGNDFYQSFISSLEKEARQFGYSLIIMQSGDDPQIELENLKRCKQSRMAGIFVSITSKTIDIHNFLKLGEQHIPVIFIDKVPAFEACNKVCVDDSAAATMAAEALILKKKQRILAIFGNTQMSITSKRLKAFKETFTKYSADTSLEITHANSTQEAQDILMDTLENSLRPDAIFCMSDEILIGVMKAVQRFGLHPPEDIGVIAISDGYVPTFYYPQITYVETSGFKLAKTAFARMQACIAGSTYAQELKIDSMIVEGGSL
ncbi:LacI family transcriptional regulator [Mucilaginibacter sp. BJC16-A38]|uniref:LacI family DNA-binding transcriptional regulator n=1 Tax=Mucilaginibacter phenanthrenivorans TaxID=1234842 RepID=UPI002157F936|nr:LacI family DNA-binding transcriptional regulator [Mucilaginibacter phenanthrenivorans]MCR8560258.1 LacI family transcriptional regulator [Mucilaginibacter phenanthrenivorans]